MDARIDQLPKSTCDLIRPVLRAEMQNAFVNNTNRLVEPIQKSITIAIQDSLKSLPSALADSINRLLRDKNFAIQFARSTSTALSSDLAVAYRDSLQRTLVPALDKNINRLFEELNAVFKTGTQQYLQQIEQSIRPTPDTTALASAVVSQIIPEIQGWAQSSTGSMNNDTCIGSGRNTRPDRMLSPVRQPKNNVDQQYSNTAGMTKPGTTHLSSPDPRSSVTGCASTTNPVESSKIKEDPNKPFRQAQRLIKDNKLVEALELALVSTNQELVLGRLPWSCGDISVALELKLKYLREAVLSLDKDDPTTTEHGPRILGLLNRRLQNYLQSSVTDTAPSMANVSASLRFRVLKLQHEAKWILDCLTKVNSSV
ncbi:Serine/threonine kinase [Fasciola gigantica]|uniref:Serine/threonine kinase n=1 Tax=Fasciola gigantica TaxID=46835 RepID=A0A504YDZ6_FASGI|nr:Serine/threonine kinase [Fasciola gigantica]